MTDDTKPAAPADAQPVVCNRAEDAQPMAWCYVKEGVEGPCFNGRGRRFETYNEGWTEVPLYSADALAALRAERDEFRRKVLRWTAEAERAERDLAAATEREEGLRRALVKTLAWLDDPQLSQWPYMENGPFYDDLREHQDRLRAALAAKGAGE